MGCHTLQLEMDREESSVMAAQLEDDICSVRNTHEEVSARDKRSAARASREAAFAALNSSTNRRGSAKSKTERMAVERELMTSAQLPRDEQELAQRERTRKTR